MLNNLIKIVAGLSQLRSASGRYKFLQGLLEGVPRLEDVLLKMNLDGDPMTVAREIVFSLKDAGTHVGGRKYLFDFVNALLDTVTGEEELTILREIAQELAPGSTQSPAPAPRLNFTTWSGERATDYRSFKEKVIGEDTLRPFFYVRLAVQAGGAVCRISGPEGLGSGFLIAPNLLMTNNHVLSKQEQLAKTELWFRYEQNPNGTDAAVVSIKPDPGGIFHTDTTHDVTVFSIPAEAVQALQDAGIQPLPLAKVPAKVGDRVAIIQHPGGLQKKISFQNNKVQGTNKDLVDYTTTTLPGSSGSPVLNDAFEVVALHREGGELKIPDSDLFYYMNRGTSVQALRKWLKDNGIA
jgi:V8-like Glu-specific endopeptidase